jgi:hypothetical protein
MPASPLFAAGSFETWQEDKQNTNTLAQGNIPGCPNAVLKFAEQTLRVKWSSESSAHYMAGKRGDRKRPDAIAQRGEMRFFDEQSKAQQLSECCVENGCLALP